MVLALREQVRNHLPDLRIRQRVVARMRGRFMHAVASLGGVAVPIMPRQAARAGDA
jgi:hypothetical protein